MKAQGCLALSCSLSVTPAQIRLKYLKHKCLQIIYIKKIWYITVQTNLFRLFFLLFVQWNIKNIVITIIH